MLQGTMNCNDKPSNSCRDAKFWGQSGGPTGWLSEWHCPWGHAAWPKTKGSQNWCRKGGSYPDFSSLEWVKSLAKSWFSETCHRGYYTTVFSGWALVFMTNTPILMCKISEPHLNLVSNYQKRITCIPALFHSIYDSRIALVKIMQMYANTMHSNHRNIKRSQFLQYENVITE